MSLKRTKCFHNLNVPLTREQFYSNGTEPQFKESWTHEELQQIAKKLKIRHYNIIDNYGSSELFRLIDNYFKNEDEIEKSRVRLDFQHYMFKKTFDPEEMKKVEVNIEREERNLEYLLEEKKKMVFQK